jgi:hypothetical protein
MGPRHVRQGRGRRVDEARARRDPHALGGDERRDAPHRRGDEGLGRSAGERQKLFGHRAARGGPKARPRATSEDHGVNAQHPAGTYHAWRFDAARGNLWA